jgi:succinate dehydrogenase / fumarate reductase membrane anchor subunit
MDKGIKETSKKGGVAWLLQRISAVFLFLVLIGHFILYHFIKQGDLKKAELLTYIRYPWFSLIQFLFLTAALYHGLNGVWMIIEDYVHGKLLRIILFSSLITVGLGLLFIGTLTIIRVSGMAG